MERLIQLLQRNTLTAEEEHMLDAVLRWVRHDIDSRRHHLKHLLSFIKLGVLKEEYLVKYVMTDELMELCELDDSILHEHKMQSERIQSRRRGYVNMVVVTGGDGPSGW